MVLLCLTDPAARLGRRWSQGHQASQSVSPDPRWKPIAPSLVVGFAGNRLTSRYHEAVPLGDGRLNHDLDPHDRGPQDACGVFGVWAPDEEVAKLAYFGIYALQHRGQESAGIAVSKGRQIMVFKDMGLVSQVFN